VKHIKMTMYHTHPNPAWRPSLRNEPLLLVVPGWSCSDCPKADSDQPSKRRTPASGGGKKSARKPKPRKSPRSVTRRVRLAGRTGKASV
jgi:hypothetical protein